MSTYAPIVTLLGQAQIADAIANDGAIDISHLAVGDGGGAAITPLETMDALTNEVWRGSVTSAGRDPNDPTKVIFTATIPLEVGPFIVREIAIFASDGEMFAVGAYPEQFKPTAAQGAVSSIEVEFVVVVSETAQVTVAINPSSLVFVNGLARIPFYAVDGIETDPDPDPTPGDMVIVAADANGAFAGHTSKLAQWNGSVWLIAEPPVGTVAGVPDGEYYRWSGAAWVLWRASASAPGPIVLNETLAKLPIYPEAMTDDGKIAITDNEDGTITVDPDQILRWRGFRDFDTGDFDVEDRTFMHAANKTYHLRFHPPGHGDAANIANYPRGRFVLKDVAAAGYNPGAVDEAAAAFDSGYDDVLLARVVTSAGNEPTIAELVNKAHLTRQTTVTGSDWQDAADNTARCNILFALDWARSPSTLHYSVIQIGVGASGTEILDGDRSIYAIDGYPGQQLDALPKDRYGSAFVMMWDYGTVLTLSMSAAA